METNQIGANYRIWGADNAAYGPVELPVVVEWINEERVTADTWVYQEPKAVWTKATELPELQMFFSPPAQGASGKSTKGAAAPPSALEVRGLRRIKILSLLSEAELAILIKYMEVQEFRIFAEVVRVGEHGDAMYLILSGELRARTVTNGKETTLATLSVGDFFGEISLLDEGPRSADVIANTDSQVLKFSSDSFKKLRAEVPELALNFMYALGRSAAGKIRSLTKRYQDSIQFSRYAQWT